MNTIDFIILILLLWGAINGFIKGFVIQSLTLVALILGVWVGIHFSYIISDFLRTRFSLQGKIMPILSMIILFILVLILVHFIGQLLTTLINQNILGKLNRIGGILFGILKMAFILSVCMLIISKIDPRQKFITPEDQHKSYFYKPIAYIAPAIFPHFHLEEIKKKLLKNE